MGLIAVDGGNASTAMQMGEVGSISTLHCPQGRYGILCTPCPVGTYKSTNGTARETCLPCEAIPKRAVYLQVPGGATSAQCPYECSSEASSEPDHESGASC